MSVGCRSLCAPQPTSAVLADAGCEVLAWCRAVKCFVRDVLQPPKYDFEQKMAEAAATIPLLVETILRAVRRCQQVRDPRGAFHSV